MKTKTKEDRFIVDNDEKANWTLKKIRELKEEVDNKEEFAEEEIDKLKEDIARIKDWFEEIKKKKQNQIDYFEGLLLEYAERLREDDPELKTYKLPFGKIMFRKKRPKWNYEEDKLLKSCEKAGLSDVIQVKKRVNKNQLYPYWL